jgi:hypothetical protein
MSEQPYPSGDPITAAPRPAGAPGEPPSGTPGAPGAPPDGAPGEPPDSAPPDSTGDRADRRAAHLLPEERATGSDDPHAQAEAILADSDLREADQEAAPDSFVEHRTSAQAADL